MNRFITLCACASALAMLLIFLSWLLKPSSPTVTLSAAEWMCVDTAPNGLNAECIQYTRKPKQQVRG